MKSMRIFCPGKVNLSLNVGGREASGYHQIDSIMQSISVGDKMEVFVRDDGKINVEFVGGIGASWMDFGSIDPKNNSVTKAISLIKEKIAEFGLGAKSGRVGEFASEVKSGRVAEFGLDVKIEKCIPLSGGLGGSSANSAGIIYALDHIFGLAKSGIDLIELAKNVGSDVPFMLQGGCVRVGGIGEKLKKIQNNLPLYMVIATPMLQNRQCVSGAIYSAFDRINKSGILANNDKLESLLADGDATAVRSFSNGLSEACLHYAPEIEDTFGAIKSTNPLNVVLCGSGSSVFGCYSTKREMENACDVLSNRKNLAILPCTGIDYGVTLI